MNTGHALGNLFWGTFCLIFFQGCLEHTITTTVRSDGSCVRVIEVASEKDSAFNSSFPLRRDGSWKMDRRREAAQDKKGAKFIATATKEFGSLDALAKEYSGADSAGKILVRISGERRFRWFYTYIRYSETYDIVFPYVRLPLAAYMTEEEVRRYQNGENNDTLKRKADAWYDRCQFEFIFSLLAKEVREIQDPDLRPEFFESQKDEIARAIRKGDEQKKLKTAADAVLILQHVLHTRAAQKLTDAVDRAMRAVLEKEERSRGGGDSYTNTVAMPGLILESNAPEIVGVRATWHTDSDRLKLQPFAMTVESRVVNVWAFVITGFIVLVMIAFIVWIGVRRFRLR